MIDAMKIEAFFDSKTNTLTYVVYDESTNDAVIIDPVLDYDPASVQTSTTSLDNVVQFIRNKSLRVHHILETHAHADHLSGAHELVRSYFPEAKIAIGARIIQVQETFKKILNFPQSFKTDGSQFHKLLYDGEEVSSGSLKFKVIFTPGHTPACASYLFDGVVFTGDALFMPDFGTGRCDFPDGDPRTLYHSVAKRLYELPDSTRVFVGHDYQPNGRELLFETSIEDSKRHNIHINADTTEADFVAFRTSRDAALSTPKLLYPSIQVNIAAGSFPDPDSNGTSYLKLPITKR